MNASSFFRSKGLTTVCGQTYPGTFAIARCVSFLAEQVHNRDSASWKKAEHIVVEEIQQDEGRHLLNGWRSLTNAEPIGRSQQKLYVAVGFNCFVLYDADGVRKGAGTLEQLFAQ